MIYVVFRKPIKIAPQTELSRVARLVKPACAVRDEDSRYEIAVFRRNKNMAVEGGTVLLTIILQI